MSRKSPYSEEELNAFIDDELPANEAAVLLRALSGDRHLAMRVSDLTRLKAEVRGCIDEGDLRMPDIDAIYRAVPSPRPRFMASFRDFFLRLISFLSPRGWRASYFAAAGGMLAVLLVGAVVFGNGFFQKPAGREDRFLARALAVHDRWIREPAGPAMKGPLHLADFITDSGRIVVPDLSASRLNISLLERFGADGLHVGYSGVHGCRLSLFIQGNAGGKARALQKRREGKAQAYLWSTKNLDFAVMAVGMDPSRLELIANDVFLAAQTMQPLEEKMRLALSANLRQSRSCIG